MRSCRYILHSAIFLVSIWSTCAILGCARATAQSAPAAREGVTADLSLGTPAPPSTASQAGVSAALVDLASRAAVIFTGQVLAVTPADGIVDIRFGIENPIRNCPGNGDYVLREWAGLWTAHQDRYRVGQHLLMFLTARGPAGISAPVGVNDGILPLVATMPQPLADSSGKAPDDSAPAELTVDLRWLQTRVARVSVAPVQFNALSVAGSADKAWSGPVVPLATVQAPSLASIVALIGTGAGDVQR